MASETALRAATGPPASERFRRTESAVWAHYGLAPTERVIQLTDPHLRVRILEVGSGQPVLMVHGTIGSGAFPSLIEADGGQRRFIVIDRPGWGGSQPFRMAAHDYRRLSADILAGVLDALGIERATVIGGSIGDVWALSFAERYPARVDRVVLLGGGPLTDAVTPPPLIRRVASPLGAVMVRLPLTTSMLRSMLAGSGHAPSLADGRIPDAFLAYRTSAGTDTAAMRHERTMIKDVVEGNAWRQGLVFGDAALARIPTPVLMLWGTADGLGDEATWRRFLSSLPNGALEVVPGAGHMLWFDELRRVADRIDGFLGG